MVVRWWMVEFLRSGNFQTVSDLSNLMCITAAIAAACYMDFWYNTDYQAIIVYSHEARSDKSVLLYGCNSARIHKLPNMLTEVIKCLFTLAQGMQH